MKLHSLQAHPVPAFLRWRYAEVYLRTLRLAFQLLHSTDSARPAHCKVTKSSPSNAPSAQLRPQTLVLSCGHLSSPAAFNPHRRPWPSGLVHSPVASNCGRTNLPLAPASSGRILKRPFAVTYINIINIPPIPNQHKHLPIPHLPATRLFPLTFRVHLNRRQPVPPKTSRATHCGGRPPIPASAQPLSKQ